MGKLSKQCKEHLESALETDDPSEKDYYIRQVLQACSVDDLPEELEAE